MLRLRGHLLRAVTRSPVTDPATKDTRQTLEGGADLSAGWRIALGPVSLTPYAGVVSLAGTFTVTSDGPVRESGYTGLIVAAGLRLLVVDHWEAVVELDAHPGRHTHVSLMLGYNLDPWGR